MLSIFWIALKDLSIKQKRYLKPIDIARWDGHFYRDKHGNFLDDFIIKAWMPLPEYPKED
jgi:hypothetical protein